MFYLTYILLIPIFILLQLLGHNYRNYLKELLTLQKRTVRLFCKITMVVF